MLVSQREYAKHRGCSHVYINKLVKQGKIPAVDGKIDPAQADQALNQNTRERAARMGPDTIGGPAPLPRGAHRSPLRSIETDDPQIGRTASNNPTYNQARIFFEVYRGKKEQLEYNKMVGKLIDVEDVEKHCSRINANIASRLRAIPAKLTPQLTGITNPGRVNAILQKEIYQALEELVTIAGTVVEE